MSTKSPAVDDGVENFHYLADLSIDPPLPDSKAKAGSSEFLKLKQIKDEDVMMVDGAITVVARHVTGVEATKKPSEYCYGYTSLKAGIGAAAKIAKDAGSAMNGFIIVRDQETNKIFRLKVDNNTVTAEAALLGWPDGTNTPMPNFGED